MVPSLPLLSCELSVSVKENPDRKKKKKRNDCFLSYDCTIVYMQRDKKYTMLMSMFTEKSTSHHVHLYSLQLDWECDFTFSPLYLSGLYLVYFFL